jgi:hypothetical protein
MLLRSSLSLLGLSLFSTVLGKTGPLVTTSSGSYLGVRDAQNEVEVFKGIRFASRPTRFTPATPPSRPPAGVQSAAAFGADCPQLPTLLGAAGVPAGPPLRGANQSEDCLFVNVGALPAAAAYAASDLKFRFRSGGLKARLRRTSCRFWFTSMCAHPLIKIWICGSF